MRILFLTQWFNPEPQFKGLAFAKELQRRGHQVEVLTGFPNYPGGKVYPGYRIRLVQREVMEGVPVIRVALYPSHDRSPLRRIFNYLSFALSATLIGPWLVGKADVMYVLHPPATMGMPAIAISLLRRIPFVYDVQDLWPDTLRSTGMVRFGWMIAMVDVWCRFVYRIAGGIAVLSSGFERILLERQVPIGKIHVIPNWCDEEQLHPGELRKEEQQWFHGRFSIVFAGNMGRAQALETVIQAAALLKPRYPLVQFILVGNGVEAEGLRRKAEQSGADNLVFLAARPVSEIGPILHHADALLVHLKRDPLFEITIPSKIQAYLSVGRPILCGVSGDASTMVNESGAGICYQPDDPAALLSAIQTLMELTPEQRELMGHNGQRYYREHLSLEVGTNQFESVFRSLAE